VADIDLPYDTLQTFSLPGETEVPDKWWLAFEDKKLNSLIDTALNSNLSLKTVWYQFEESMALVDIASSAKWPDVFLEFQSGISRPEPDFVGGENTQLSLGASYEIDLWGRIRYNVHAEEYRLKASYYDYKTAAVSLAGEIALTWFRLKATKIQLQLIDDQVETNEKVLALIRARFASGQIRGVDILRQQQLIEATREQKIALESQMGILQNQLSILLGQPPGEPFDVVTAQLPALPPLPQTGIPLQLVNRRPDVQSAFNRLQASDREVAVAISNKYPRLTLSVNAAIRSNSLTNLFQSQALSISSSLLAPIFYGGRLNAEVDRTEAIRQQLLNEYGQNVLIAFREVEDALIQETKLLEQIEIVEEQVNLAEKTYNQLRMEYLNGSIAYLDVLVTLDQQQQLRRDLINARMTLLEIRIALYRALAGGFETEKERRMNEES
jgi:multidrug efflux system outer membrane protein